MLKKILKNKKGLTLIELVVGLVIFGIISVAVSASLAPTLFAFMRANDFAEYNILMDNIANQIISDLSQSTVLPEFTEAGDWPEPGWNDLTIIKSSVIIHYSIMGSDSSAPAMGILQREIGGETWEVFPVDFYKRKVVAFKLETYSEDPLSYTLTVRLENSNGDFILERDYAVRPLILNQHTPDASDEENGDSDYENGGNG